MIIMACGTGLCLVLGGIALLTGGLAWLKGCGHEEDTARSRAIGGRREH